MGLDITAASQIDFSRALTEEEAYPLLWIAGGEPPTIYLYINPHFPAHAQGLGGGSDPALAKVTAALLGGQPEPAYFVVRGERHDFQAGSYSGYSQWRARLGEFAATVDAGDAFHDLIEFSDCEGCIGPVVSAQLAKAFAKWGPRTAKFAKALNAFKDEGEWFLQKYRNWRRAFELAANNGAVQFH